MIKSGSVRDRLALTDKAISEDSKAESRYRFDSINERPKYALTEPSLVNNNINNKKKEKSEAYLFPSYDIRDLNAIEDNAEVIKLRQQKLFEIQRITLEKQLQKEAEEQEKITTNNKIKAKPFDSIKYTFDSNGAVIAKRIPRLEFLSKEFYWMKFDIKNIETKRDECYKKKNNEKKQLEIIYNPNTNVAFNQNNLKLNEKKEINRIMPSGSNFDILLPEIGVRITEDRKIKGGAKDFSTKYKKTSNDDYEKLLNEFIPQLNASLIKSKLGNTMQSAYNVSSNLDNSAFIQYTEPNYSLEKSSFLNQSNQNPLLGNNDDKKNKRNAYEYDNSNAVTNRFRINTSVDFTKQFNTSSKMFTEEEIIMNKNFNSSLKIAMDSIHDLDFYNQNPINKFKQTKNDIFKPTSLKLRMKENKAIQDEDENIKYTKNIIKSKDWGKTRLINPVVSFGNYQTFFKPSQLSLERELGWKIINTKTPRSRRYNHDLHIK